MNKITQTGFSLVELLVAMFLTAVIFTVGASVFIQTLELQRKAFSAQDAQENATHVLESMAKEIRVAQIMSPIADSNCPMSPDSTLTILHPVNGTVSYTLSGTYVYRSMGGNLLTMNSSNAEFTGLKFCVRGAGSGDGMQPRVTIVATVRSAATKLQTTVTAQTTMSQRFLNDE